MKSKTLAIGQKGAQSLYHCFEQSARLGRPLNTHVTINFSASTRCEPQKAVEAFKTLRKSNFARWASRRGLAPTGCYVFENSRDGMAFETMEPGDDHNVHVHWALYVPPALTKEFEQKVWDWVEARSGGITSPTAIKITGLTPDTLKRYLLKGTVANWAPIYGAISEPQGLIVGGRRSGTTHNVGSSARRATDRALGVRRRIPGRPKRLEARAAIPSI